MTYRSKIYKIAAVWLYSRLPATFYLWFTHRYKTTPINYWLIVINNWTWRCLSNTSRKKQLKDMESKFKVGDRVRLKANGNIAQVVIVKDGWIAYDENRRIAGSCPMEEAEPYDPKTAFLSELKGLLEKYDAQIGCNPVHDDEFEICIDFKDSMVSYPSYIQWLNAGYVSHFKKE